MSPKEFQESVAPFMPDIRNYITDLTKDQALKLYQYEQDINNRESKTYSFSFWEEMDFKWASFKEILTSEQFADYESFHKETVAKYGKQLYEVDSMLIGNIEYEREWVAYHEQVFYKSFFVDRNFFDFLRINRVDSRIELLKIEYQKYLKITRKNIIVSHFRYSRVFEPNSLKLKSLSLLTQHFWPCYACFIDEASPETMALANAIYYEFNFLYIQKKEFLEQQLSERQNFYNNILQRKHSAQECQNYLQKLKEWESGPENSDKYKFMSLLLMDKGKYGYYSENEIDLHAQLA
jgi:hypothetical protein